MAAALVPGLDFSFAIVAPFLRRKLMRLAREEEETHDETDLGRGAGRGALRPDRARRR